MGRGKLWAIVRREYLERVLNKWFAIATVFGPIVLGALLFLPAYFATRDRASPDLGRIVVLDATGSDLGRRVASQLSGGASGDTSLVPVVPTDSAALPREEERARVQARARVVAGFIVLDAQTMAGLSARYVGSNATAFTDMARIQEIVSEELLALRLEERGISADEADRLKQFQVELREEQLSSSAAGGGRSGRVSVLSALAVAVLLYVTIFLYGQTVLRGVIEEKQSRVAEIVVSSVSPMKLLTGKVLGVGAVGLTQLLVWTVLGFVMVRVREGALGLFGIESAPLPLPSITPSSFVLLLLFFLLGYLFYAALFAAIGALVSTEQEAQQAQLPVAMFLVLAITFLQPVLRDPNGTLAFVLGIIPFTAPILMPLRMSLVAVPTWQIAVSLAELVLACYIVVGLSARIYRVGVLMYGKQATMREVLRWIRVR